MLEGSIRAALAASVQASVFQMRPRSGQTGYTKLRIHCTASRETCRTEAQSPVPATRGERPEWSRRRQPDEKPKSKHRNDLKRPIPFVQGDGGAANSERQIKRDENGALLCGGTGARPWRPRPSALTQGHARELGGLFHQNNVHRQSPKLRGAPKRAA